jgi:hypothetical protein
MESLKNIPEVKNNVYLANVFNFEDFAVNSRLTQVIRAKPAKADDRFATAGINADLDYGIIKTLIDKIVAQYAKKNVDDVLAMYPSMFLDITFENSFMPYIREFYKSNVKAEQIKNDISKLVYNINVSSLDRIPLEIQSMPNDMFAFGEKLYLTPNDFKMDVFKRDMSNIISRAFFIILYHKHLQYRSSACAGEMQCQRVYNLAQYIFVYYTVMTLFLYVYGSNELVNKYSKESKESMEALQTTKYTLISIMDNILARLQEKNLLNPGSLPSGKTSMSAYHDNIKELSTNNKLLSQDLTTKRMSLTNLQNNLASYNSMEMITHRATITANVSLWFTIVLVTLLVGGVIVLLMRERYATADLFMLLITIGVLLFLTKWYIIIWQKLTNFFVQ